MDWRQFPRHQRTLIIIWLLLALANLTLFVLRLVFI